MFSFKMARKRSFSRRTPAKVRSNLNGHRLVPADTPDPGRCGDSSLTHLPDYISPRPSAYTNVFLETADTANPRYLAISTG